MGPLRLKRQLVRPLLRRHCRQVPVPQHQPAPCAGGPLPPAAHQLECRSGRYRQQAPEEPAEAAAPLLPLLLWVLRFVLALCWPAGAKVGQQAAQVVVAVVAGRLLGVLWAGRVAAAPAAAAGRLLSALPAGQVAVAVGAGAARRLVPAQKAAKVEAEGQPMAAAAAAGVAGH